MSGAEREAGEIFTEAADKLLEASSRWEKAEKVGKLVWLLGSVVVAVAAWVTTIQIKLEAASTYGPSIHRIDRNVTALATKIGVPVEQPRD